jgi:hypothetical protein
MSRFGIWRLVLLELNILGGTEVVSLSLELLIKNGTFSFEFCNKTGNFSFEFRNITGLISDFLRFARLGPRLLLWYTLKAVLRCWKILTKLALLSGACE